MLKISATQSHLVQSDLPTNLVFLDDGYKAFTVNSHERGKWYYEVWIDRNQIAKMGDLLITPGYFSQKNNAIRMVNIRHTQIGMGPLVIGMALDLTDGFVYMRQNGEWKIAPGFSGAIVMPLNGAYVGGVEASSQIHELIRRGLVQVNVGQRLFAHSAPDGYRAWGEN